MNSIYLGTLVCAIAVGFAGCANNPNPTMGDLMYKKSHTLQGKLENVKALATQWDKGTEMVKEGQRKIDAGNKKLNAGQKELDEGKSMVAEGSKMVSDSEAKFASLQAPAVPVTQ